MREEINKKDSDENKNDMNMKAPATSSTVVRADPLPVVVCLQMCRQNRQAQQHIHIVLHL